MTTYDSWKTHDAEEDRQELLDKIEQSNDYEARVRSDDEVWYAVMTDQFDLARKRMDEILLEMEEEWEGKVY